MALTVVTITLSTLSDLLLEEARFLYGVSNDVREIRGQLEMMKSFLKDADARQHKEDRVRTWVLQVRRLAFRIEDVLETYVREVVFKKRRGIIKRFVSLFSEGKALHVVGEEILYIKSEITNLKTSREIYGIEDLSIEGESSRESREKQRLLRQTYSHEVEEHFVGMKDDIRELVSLITDNDRNRHRVVSIWGMGGSGKTTLARKIFNHNDVKHSFGAFAWVCVTQDCQIVKILQDILKQVLGEDIDEDQPTLVRELHKVLLERKCLVVLDDIWKIDDWEILRHAFPITGTCSQVLLTTRIKEVARKGFLYKLKLMKDEEGWELLRRKTRTKLDVKDCEIASTFELIGKEIVQKCGHLPLAISVIGGILREKISISEWKTVNGDIDLYLRRGEASHSVPDVLCWSYDELPYYLKPCFLYLGNYREDETINVEKLYRLWIAEGLVLSEHCGGTETMVDVAEQYLNELASRCMVEVEMDDMSIVQRLKSCRLHDLMRDISLAKGKEEEFIKIIDLPDLTGKTLMNLPSLFDNGRRLSMTIPVPSDLEEKGSPFVRNLFEQEKIEHIRTLFIHFLAFRRFDALDISNLKKFKLLRVLDLHNCEFKLPREISELIHLRYLSLRDCEVEELPSSVSNLPYLQTLDLRTWDSINIPNIFSMMRRLKHIYLPHTIEGLQELQFMDMTELETLHGFQCSHYKLMDLSGLVNLRSFSGILEIDASPRIIDEINSWRKIKWMKIQLLSSVREQYSGLWRKVLLCENLHDFEIVGPIGKFPPYEPQSCSNLTRLRLVRTKLKEDPMLFLKKLPNLRNLSLTLEAFVGKEMVCDAMAFPQLRHLTLFFLTELEIWRVDESAMPNLSHLTISDCKRLVTITEGLNLSTLTNCNIWPVPEGIQNKYSTLYDREKKTIQMV